MSYTRADRKWAEWIAWQTEAAGYSVLFQDWDFVAGANWIQLMQAGVTHAERVLVVLSDSYLKNSSFGAVEWQAIWAQDPAGARHRVIPVRIADCTPSGMLAGIVRVDLFDLSEAEASARLRKALYAALDGRAKPATAPSYPGGDSLLGRDHDPASDLRTGRPRTATPRGYASPPDQHPGFPDPTVAIIDALEFIPALRSSGGRSQLLEVVCDQLPHLAVQDDLFPRLFFVQLVRRCRERPGGFRALNRAVQLIAPGEPGALRVQEIVRSLDEGSQDAKSRSLGDD